MRNPVAILLPALLFAGCTTVKYEPKATAGPAKPANYPVYVYAETTKIPRPHEVVGSMRVGDTPITMFGGTIEGVLETLRKHAREKGADALQLTSVQAPGFTSANYRANANFLRFTDVWESVAVSEEGLKAYFQTNAATLDPIEGVWTGNDPARSRIAIMRNSTKPGREFVAVVLGTMNPSWHPGDKKLDILRGERPGVYRGSFFLDDYQEKKVAITLRGPPENRFLVHLPEGPPLAFRKAGGQRLSN